ncbi:hypothetical protein CUJ84_Chr003863 [Rhizobium leguminosarum]|uniref:Uncharacterized protein n=1 Tax=Rhizobium leguminosarum TaxID=384 RepID=A0A2K9Z7G9_RHILE|nr:hypothetical protein CUJ84_Chr003863 [Rhizobium leguminosarum]
MKYITEALFIFILYSYITLIVVNLFYGLATVTNCIKTVAQPQGFSWGRIQYEFYYI